MTTKLMSKCWMCHKKIQSYGLCEECKSIPPMPCIICKEKPSSKGLFCEDCFAELDVADIHELDDMHDLIETQRDALGIGLQ